MKLLIMGATGPTGRLAAFRAVEVGHDVTLLVRNPDKVTRELSEKVRVVRGDATTQKDVKIALAGQDALISSLGGGGSAKPDIASKAAAVFVPAAEELAIKRLVVLSAFGVGETGPQGSWVQRALNATAGAALIRDKTAADDIVKSSQLDWTLAYPVILTDKPKRPTQIAQTLPMRGLPQVSRADVANFLVDSLDSTTWVGRVAVLSS